MEKMEKTLFKQGGPFSTKAGIHRGPVLHPLYKINTIFVGVIRDITKFLII